MPKAKDLIKEIGMNLSGMLPYSNWTVGMTGDPDRRHRELDFPGFWRVWAADDELEARHVVEHFVTEGANQDSGGARGGRFVYMF